MQQAQQIIKDIKNKQFSPIYFLMGDEPFYIDSITKSLEDHVLEESEKAFNLNVFYGKDIDIASIIGYAKQYPMAAERSLLIIKEAQHLSRSIESLLEYAQHPQPSTVLVINYKYKTLDKRKKLYKALQKNAILFESKKLYDNQLPEWIANHAQSKGMAIDTKSKFLLAEFLGNDLSRINNEINKLQLVIKTEPKQITAELIEQHIGISKDYNNFELLNAIGSRDMNKILSIVFYFDKNPKSNPIVVTLAVLYNFFANLIIYHSLTDKSQQNVVKELKIKPFFVKDYQQAQRSYNLKQTTRIISVLREIDLKSKGVGAINQTDGTLLKELVLKIMSI